MTVRHEFGFVLRGDPGAKIEEKAGPGPWYLMAMGYGGPGKPLPYWTPKLEEAKKWTLRENRLALETQRLIGGEIQTIQRPEGSEKETDWAIAEQ